MLSKQYQLGLRVDLVQLKNITRRVLLPIERIDEVFMARVRP